MLLSLLRTPYRPGEWLLSPGNSFGVVFTTSGPFVEIISPVPRASELPLEDAEIEPFFLIQLIHQTAKDFLASDEASVFRTTAESAMLAVEQEKIRYLSKLMKRAGRGV